MPQTHRITILIPLVVGACVVACTIFIHALAVGATVSFVRYEKNSAAWVQAFGLM